MLQITNRLGGGGTRELVVAQSCERAAHRRTCDLMAKRGWLPRIEVSLRLRLAALPVSREAKGRAPGPSGSNETAACYP